MPVMKITVTFAVPDAGLHVLKRCAYLLERPFHGFLKNLVERQERWVPEGARVGHMDLAVEIETTEGERTCSDFEQHQLRETRDLMRRLRDRGFRASSLRPSEKIAA
jgi:hypothetical protein